MRPLFRKCCTAVCFRAAWRRCCHQPGTCQPIVRFPAMPNLESIHQHTRRVLGEVQHPQGSGLVRPHIARSWSRCLNDFGIEPDATDSNAVVEGAALRERQQRMGNLLALARAEMENLHEQIAGSGSAVVLADADATLLLSITEPGLKRDFRQAGLWNGAIWDERHQGTNGIGTCVAEGRSVTVHRDEHYLGSNIGLCCSGAPILDPHGQVLAVLDVSSANRCPARTVHSHTMAMVNMSARLISRCHFVDEFPRAHIMRFHSRPEFVGLLHEALLAIDDDGLIVAANESALEQLGFDERSRLLGRSVEEIFQFSYGTLQQRARNEPGTIWSIRDGARGCRLFARIKPPARNPARCHETLAPAGRRGNSANTAEHPPERNRYIGTDARIRHNLNCAAQVFGRRVPILLQGATGSGKEAFAKCVHRRSDWADKPFVAVNCGSIPEPLIESELFGYARGAFTDARREGRPGKILQSSGGTLFLDEIGDMPLTLQTRLLRVLEDREVVPLGEDTAIPVDLHLISATHRDIRQMVQSGEFREDLFYRLNGTTLYLPNLRDREDKSELIHQILIEESVEGESIRIRPDALRYLLEYGWPGNVRQLRNVLRTAAALCSDSEIRPSNLPQELIDGAGDRILPAQPPISVPAMVVSGTVDAGRGRDALGEAERAALIRELEQLQWNITQTAEKLGVSRNTLYRKMRKHGITVPP